MAIARTLYAEIHDLVRVEKRKVSEVATKFGCSANNIYHIVTTEASARETVATVAAAVALAQAATRMDPPAPVPALSIPEPMSGPFWEHPRAVANTGMAKGGSCLVIRSPDGDENELPFRSLEELLSSVKPILREAARCGEEIWFSIRDPQEGGDEAVDGDEFMPDDDAAEDGDLEEAA